MKKKKLDQNWKKHMKREIELERLYMCNFYLSSKILLCRGRALLLLE